MNDAQPTSPHDTCLDCGTGYDAAMALSLLIPKAQWLLICPKDGGLLCANCMLRRAAKLQGVINITGRITFSSEYNEGQPTPYDIISGLGAS